jgi:hypothetical protein
MMTSEERIGSLHTKMAARRKWREKRTIRQMSAACAALTLCLVFLVFGGGAHPGGTAGVYTGAAMLFTGAGAYVLTAVVAFMLGVAITVFIKWKQDRQRQTEGGNR